MWCHVEEAPSVVTHADRIFGFVSETRRRCTRCRLVRSWYSGDNVLKVRPRMCEGGPLTVSEMYLAACACNAQVEEIVCTSEECKNAITKHVSQCRMMSVPNVLVIQVQRDAGRRIPVAVEEQLDLPGCDAMQLIGVLYHNGPSIHSGHYTSLCRGPGGRFWFYNDDRPVCRMYDDVAHVKPSEVYMVVYAKANGASKWGRQCEMADEITVGVDAIGRVKGSVASSDLGSVSAVGTDQTVPHVSPGSEIGMVRPTRRLRRKSSAEEALGASEHAAGSVLSPSRRLRRKTLAAETLSCSAARIGAEEVINNAREFSDSMAKKQKTYDFA